MNTHEFITSFALPVAASIAVLWLAYRLLFVNSNRFKFNRSFLLVALLFSLALPLVGLLMGSNAPQIVEFRHSMFSGYTLNEIVITPDGPVATPIVDASSPAASTWYVSLWMVLGIIYLIGVAVMAVLFIVKLVRLVVLIIRSPKCKMDGYTAVYTHKEQGSFSFFRYAFFPDENVSSDIVRHEMSHIAHGHSWDILFVEIIMILQWFNPFIYFYKRELQSLHEYSADHDVVTSGVDKKNYMMLILQQCTAVDFSSMSNNFSLILTKKRIKMITRNERAKRLWWRLLATIPVLAVLLIANARVSAQQVSKTDMNANETNTADIADVNVTKASNDSIFNVVEVMPEYPGGMEMMIKYLSENIKYPEEAKDKGIQGRVFVQFVIEKDGSVTGVKVMRSVHPLLDNESVRVVKAMPKWKPGLQKGKPVRVSYNLPISFKMDDPKGNGLEGTTWEGTGKGTKDKVNYTMHMTMEIESATAGYFVMGLKSEQKGKTEVVFEDVGLPFTYTYDGKSMGSINPTNPDGSSMTEESMPPYGFTVDKKGNIIVNFYDFKEEVGIEKITFKKK
ncbi:MAG: TonB family protein [Bacteroidales bacterium]|nr:TonB family protein [Bacteroidales bacterium]